MRRHGVVGAQRLLIDAEGAFVQRLGGGVPTLGVVQRGEVVEGQCDIDVVGPNAFSRMLRARMWSGSASA